MNDDLIKRQAAINLLTEWSDGYSYIEIETTHAISAFKRLPPAEAVEVVRCKACNFSMTMKGENDLHYRICLHHLHGMIVEDNDFCSQGR